MAQVKKAKICQRKGKRLVCREIKIKSDVWPDGAFDSYEKLLKAAKRMVKKDGYATVIRRLNIVRIWNKNRNPRLAKRVEKVMAKLRRLHARDEI
ncbi:MULTISPECIES: hypothetical protein [unclassified Archaeoglobus]|jgi:hypothetical protein|uniref:hypothetical protein n=1 Tax=unclassified Archaeoglobus TaxID=2643606 RepID=UPI0025C58177|nr:MULTISPECIES: hypothetical protein [unclassified Archaeoglobus]